MLGDINKDLKPIEYELTLCKPDRTQIAILSEAYNVIYTARLNAIEELEFNIPYYILDDHNQIKNPNWSLTKGDYLILLNNEEYFWIDTPTNSADNDGKLYKHVHAFSLEYQLRKRKVRSYKYDSRVLYSITNELDTNGVPLGILNYLTTLTSWSIGYVDPDLIEIGNRKYRSFSIDEQSVYDVMITIQKTFSCVFLFDRINKTIDIKRVAEIGINRGLYLSEENYILSAKEDFKHDEIVNKLYCYGKDGLSIASKNPTGGVSLENWSFYKTTDYMSQSLIDALDAYDILVESKSTDFSTYLTQLSDLQTSLLTKQVELTTLQTELQVLEDSKDSAIKAGTSLSTINTQIANKNNEISAKQAEISTVDTNITAVNTNISALQILLKKENNFTAEQIIAFDELTKEETWSDENYISVDDLYEDGQIQLSAKCQPPIDFPIESVDFMKVVECQHDWDKLVLGDIVNIHYTEFDLDIQVRLLEYVHNLTENSLKLTFSNKDAVDQSAVFLNDILEKAQSTSTTVDMSKIKWDKSEDNQTQIKQILNSNWDAAKNAVLAGRKQDVQINENGIVLIDKNNPLLQMRIISNVIALSRDGFQTATLSLTPDGINAETIIGQLVASERLIITNTAGNFIVDELGATLTNLILTVTRQDNLSRTTIDPFVGIKIQKNVNGAFEDRLYCDNDGEVIAEKFKVRNTNSTLDDDGLAIYNGKILVKDSNDNTLFGVVDGNMNLVGTITTPYMKSNKDGMVVTGGKMQLVNDNGTVIIDGEHNIHKIMMTGATSITVPAGTTSYSTTLIALNLTDDNGNPYIPICLVFQQMDDGTTGLCPTSSLGSGTDSLKIRQMIRPSATSSALTLYVDRCSELAVDALSINVRYYVYKEIAF